MAAVALREQTSEKLVVREENKRVVELWKDRERRLERIFKRVVRSKSGLPMLVVSYVPSVWATLMAKTESKHLETSMEIGRCYNSQCPAEQRMWQAARGSCAKGPRYSSRYSEVILQP